MKKSTSLSFFGTLINLLLFFCVNAQNLIPNPGFENIISCPMGSSVIFLAPPWFQPSYGYGNLINSCSSDLLNTCSNASTEGIPSNEVGYQQTHSGQGYAGIFVHSDTFNYREYIEAPLLSTLIANRKYCVEFYVSLADSSEEAISNIDAYFSADSLLDNTQNHTINSVSPQIENPTNNMLNDKNNWMLVSGNFIASGGEKFITIGNFHLPANTNAQNVTGGNMYISAAYYYIDDISVTDCTVGINELEAIGNFKLYPNPNNGQMTLSYHLAQTAELSIYDMQGRRLITYTLPPINQTLNLNLEELNSGIYYYSIHTKDKQLKTEKLVMVK